MKKLVLLVLLAVAFLPVRSQIIVTPQAQVQSLEALEGGLKIGNLVFGDSITHYLRDLHLISMEKGGIIKTSLSEYDLGFFRIGGSRPAVSVYVSSKGYLIHNVSAFYDTTEEEKIRAHLRSIFGVATDYDGNAQTWVGKKLLVMASRVDGVFCVAYTYLGL